MTVENVERHGHLIPLEQRLFDEAVDDYRKTAAVQLRWNMKVNALRVKRC